MTRSSSPEASAIDALPPCLYCASRSYTPLYDDLQDRLGYVPGRWAFYRCRHCGSAVLSPFPRADELASYYPPVYSFTLELGRDSRFRGLLARLEYLVYFRPQYRAQARRVLGAIGWRGATGRRLLDVGCGRGLRLLEFRRRGFDVQGVDLQADVVEHVRRELGIPAVSAEISALAAHFAPASFDLITAFFVLEHVPSVDAMLATCFRLLKPGGWFVGAVPFLDSAQAAVFKGRWINATEAPRHLSIPTRAGMRIACRRAGYDPVTVRPDSTLNCAGQIGISLVPGGAITHAYGGGRVPALLRRLLAASGTLLGVPFCTVENHLLRRPSLGIVLAHKPEPRTRSC